MPPMALPLPFAQQDNGEDDQGDQGMPRLTPTPQQIQPPPTMALPPPGAGGSGGTSNDALGGGGASKAPDASYYGSKGGPTPSMSFYDALVAQRRAAQQAHRDAYDPEKVTVDKDAPSFVAPEHAPKGSVMGDFGRQTLLAFEGSGQAALGAASFLANQLGADPSTVAYIEDSRAKLADHMTAVTKNLSQPARDAMHASLFGGTDEQGNAIKGPSDVGWGNFVGATLASFVPDATLAIVPGGIVAAATRRAALSVLEKGAAAAAGRVAGAGATGAAFGAQAAGEAYNHMVDGIGAATEKQLTDGSEFYREQRAGGASDLEARQQMVRGIAPAYIAQQAGLGFVTGIGLGQVMTHGAMGAVGRKMLGRATIGGAEGAATMAAQGGGAAYLNQRGEQATGLRADLDPAEIAKAAATGAVGGALLGGAMGAGHRAPPRHVVPQLEEGTRAPAPGLPPAEAAALGPEVGRASVNPEAGGTMPAGPTAPTTPEQTAWPHPNADLPQPVQWPHPMDDTGQETATGLPAPAREPQTLPPPHPENTSPEAGAALPPPSTTPTTPEQVSWPHPQGPLQGPVEWPHPMEEEAGPAASALSAGPAGPAGPSGVAQDQIPAAQQLKADPAEMRPITRTEPAPASVSTAPTRSSPVPATTAEPARDIAAQLRALADPNNPKDAVFVAKGTKLPAWETEGGKMPVGILQVPRKEGMLFTTDKAKADAYRRGKLSDERIGEILGMKQAKAEALAEAKATGEAPVVVQARDKQGAVVGEAVTSKAGAAAESERLAAHAPEGSVEVHTPESVLARREEELKTQTETKVAAEPTTVVTEAPEPKKTARQIEKERMAAASGERRKGVVATAELPEGTPIAEREHAGRSFEDARMDAVGALDAVGREVVRPLRDGDLPKVMSRLQEELQAIINRGSPADQSEARVHEAIAKWGESAGRTGSAEPIALTTTRRSEIADRMLKKLGAKGLDTEARRSAEIGGVRAGDRERRAAEPVGAKERERQVAGSDESQLRERAATAESAGVGEVSEAAGLDTKGEGVRATQEGVSRGILDDPMDEEVGGSEGVQDYGAGGEAKERQAKQHKARVVRDLLRDVEDGKRTLAQVAYEYDSSAKKTEAGKTLGRTRTFPTFADFLEHMRERAGNEDAERTALVKAAEAYQAAKTKQARSELTKKMKLAMADFGHEAVERFSKLQEELRDPVKFAADREAEAEALAKARDGEHDDQLGDLADPRDAPARPPGISDEAWRTLRVFNDPRVNRAVRSKLLETERGGETAGLHELLEAVRDDPVVRSELPHMRALATRLLRLAPNITVISSERAAMNRIPFDPQRTHGTMAAGPGGRPQHIILNAAESTSHVSTLLHEAVHAAVFAHLERESRTGGRDYKVMEAIRDELLRQLAAKGELPPWVSQGRLAYTTESRYWMHELHTMLLTDARTQLWAAGYKPSMEFRLRMAELGHGMKPKSIWQSFTDLVRRAVGAKPGEMSLLDHVMRPTQDILERGAQANHERFGFHDPMLKGRGGAVLADLKEYDRSIGDPVLREQAHAGIRATGGRLDGAKDLAAQVTRRGDFPGLADKGRRALLAAVPLDAIHDWNKSLFEVSGERAERIKTSANPLTSFRSAVEGIQHVTKQVLDKLSPRVNDLIERIRAEPRLGPLMNDAGLAEAHLGELREGTDNSHLKTPEQQAELAALQARYDALPQTAKQTYQDVRDHYAQTYAAERRAKLDAMIKLALPDATPEQVSAARDVMRSKTKLDAFLKSGDSNPVATAFGERDWTAQRQIIRGIANVHKLGFVQGDYFPLRRFGDYVVRYGEGENRGVEHFESLHAAEARRAELVAQGENVEHQVDRKRMSAQDLAHSAPLIDAITDRARRNPELADHAEALRGLLASTYLDYGSRSERTRTALRRQGIAGASTDAARVLAQELVGHASRMGHIEHDPARAESLRQMGMVADDLARHGRGGEALEARSVITEAEKRLSSGDDAQGVMAGVSRTATQLGFVQSLMSFSHAFTSSIEAHTNSTALLGARHGFGRATLALTKALTEITPKMTKQGMMLTGKAVKGLASSDWNMAHFARDRFIAAGAKAENMHALFDRLERSNLIDHSFEREMRRMGKGQSRNTAWQKFLDFNAAGAHTVDVTNKAAIAKAAFDLEMRHSGGDVAASAAYAEQKLRQAIPNYNFGNKARIATSGGPLGKFTAPVMQFKLYGVHMYSMMANLARESMRGADTEAQKAARWEARKALAGVLVSHSMMAGALTLLADPLRYAGGLYDFVTGDKPKDRQAAIRGFLSDIMGPTAAEIFSRGLPYAIGMDVHRRVGLANMLEMPEFKSFSGKDMAAAIGTAMTGASGQDALGMVEGAGHMLHGDFGKGAQMLVPRVLRDVFKAAGLAQHGVTDKTGKTILPSSKLSGWDIGLQAVGFQPSRVSEFREGRNAVDEARQEVRDERGKLSNAWLNASPTDRAAIMSQVREFNMSHPNERITMAQLLNGLKQRLQDTRNAAQFGLRLPKKSAGDYTPAGRFAVQ